MSQNLAQSGFRLEGLRQLICWLPASAVAQHLVGRVLEMPNPDLALLGCLMNDEHFEFGGGERRPEPPDRGTRLGDV